MISKAYSFLVSGASNLAVAAALWTMDSKPAAACDADTPYMGSVCFMATQFCPEGYMAANGTLLNIGNYQALYSLLGMTFGSQGSTQFALPDLRGRVPVGSGTGPGLTTVAVGAKRGAETNALNIAQLPAHNHTATFTGTGGGSGSPLSITVPVGTGTGNASTVAANSTVYLSGAAINNQNPDPVTLSGPYTTATPAATAKLGGVTASGGGGGITGGTVAIGNSGSSAPFSIISPELGLTACIATTGIYPVRP